MPRLTREAFVRYWIPVVGWLFVIAFESTSLSAARTGGIVDPILHWIFPRFSLDRIDYIHEIGRKVGHFIGYGLMSYFLFRAIRGTHHVHDGTENILRSRILPAGCKLFASLWQFRWAVLAVIGTALVATADEMHQMSDPTRTGTWWDVLLDSSGAVIFQLLVFAFIRLRTSRQQGVPETVISG